MALWQTDTVSAVATDEKSTPATPVIPRFSNLGLLEVFRLKNGSLAVKVGRSSYIKMDGGLAHKLRIKPTKVVETLPLEQALTAKSLLKE